MIRTTRLVCALLVAVLLLPSWPAVGHWAQDGSGESVSLVGAPAHETLQAPGTKESRIIRAERHAGGGGGPPYSTIAAGDRAGKFIGYGACSIEPAATAPACRPTAERLPYDATAPPAG